MQLWAYSIEYRNDEYCLLLGHIQLSPANKMSQIARQ